MESDLLFVLFQLYQYGNIPCLIEPGFIKRWPLNLDLAGIKVFVEKYHTTVLYFSRWSFYIHIGTIDNAI